MVSHYRKEGLGMMFNADGRRKRLTLHSLMFEREVTQTRMERMTGIKQPVISNLLHGSYWPSKWDCFKIAAALAERPETVFPEEAETMDFSGFDEWLKGTHQGPIPMRRTT
jgi:hypothetical protein